MALWSLTKTQFIQKFEILHRNLTGKPRLTAGEYDIVADCLNNALTDILLENGIDHVRYILTDTTVATVAQQDYVDLPENTFRITSGSVSIGDKRLIELSWTEMLAVDPERTSFGSPVHYAFFAGSSAGILRWMLWPCPDSIETIAYTAEVLPAEDSFTSLPYWFYPMLQDKFYSNTLRNLGLAQHSDIFEASYEHRKNRIQHKQGSAGPEYVQSPYQTVQKIIQGRCPDL